MAPMFGGGLPKLETIRLRKKLGLQGCSGSIVERLRSSFHGGEGCTYKDFDTQFRECKRYESLETYYA